MEGIDACNAPGIVTEAELSQTTLDRKGKGRILFPKFNVRSSTSFLSLSPPFLSPGTSRDLWGSDESNHVSPSLFVLTFARNALCTRLPGPFAVMGSLVTNGRVRKLDFHIPPDWGSQFLPRKW